MVTLSLCMVVENNIGKILDCLGSIKDIVDEIIIVNTGLCDDLKRVCSSYTTKIYDFKQNSDISDAWNYSFSLATMDYIIWLETEDILLEPDRDKFKKLKNSMDKTIDVVRMPHNFSDDAMAITSSYTRNRIVKRTDYFVWESGLSYYLPAAGKVIDSDTLVTHCIGQTGNLFQRFSIFEERLEKSEKLTTRELYYYAEKLYERKRYDKAIKFYDSFLAQKDGWTGDKLSAIDKIADIYRLWGDKENEIKYIFKSFEYDIPRAEFLCRLGVIFIERGQLDKAIYWFNYAVSLEKPKDNLGFIKEENWTWLPQLKLCACYYKIGDYEKANMHNELALSFSPTDKVLLHNRAVLIELLKNNECSALAPALVPAPVPVPQTVPAPVTTPTLAKVSVPVNEVRNTEISPFRPLKIIQVAPDIYPVPPDNYGGIEVVIYELTEELVRMGHDVYLYASEGSKTSAKLIPYKHKSKGDFNQIADYVLNTMPQGVDIIHDHTHISVLGKKELQIPTVCTIHGTINYRVKYPVFVSKRALQVIGGNHGYYVYNGLNLKEFEYCEDKQDYMLYLGRLDKIKGLDYALDVAEKTNKRLVIAGPIHDIGYYTKEVEPRIKNNLNIEYIGSVGGKKKQEVLKNAGCLLFPTSWEEPFGLVMIEAMACGTPVLALANGAVPEVLKDFPDFICHSVDEMANKVINQSFPAPRLLREYVLNNFTSKKMAEGYVQIYKKICSEQKASKLISSVNVIEKNNKKLRIVQVAPNAFPCPPKDYGGIERVVYDLTEELVRQGHEVFLYAAQGSQSSAKITTYEQKETASNMIADFVLRTLPENIDIIHDHTHACAMNNCGLSVPVVNTMHDSRKNSAKYPVYLCKKALQKVGQNNGFYAYNGINPDDYEFNEKKDDYLIFMGILYSHKGINYALDVAEKTGQKLIVAGPIYDMEYYKKEIVPRVKCNSNISYIGSVGGKERQNLLKNARCMLFPTVWEEPFGLVMIEAMACGTPVLAFGNGAVPEVMSGFPDLICSNVVEMICKVQNHVLPNAHVLRTYVENNFSSKKMADSYLDIYQKVLETTK